MIRKNIENPVQVADRQQQFMGKMYYLYQNERYYSKAANRLHRVVWEAHNGPIQDGMSIHHINEDPTDNRIENLQLMPTSKHLSLHASKPEARAWARKRMDNIRPLASEWHRSKEGRKKHSEWSKAGWDKIPYRTYTCQQCGKEFQSRATDTRKVKYCHLNCKMRAHNARCRGYAAEYHEECAVCHTRFDKPRLAKLCGQKCAARRRRREARGLPVSDRLQAHDPSST